MNASDTAFDSPLAARYASRAMAELFSPRRRILVWRDLWIALAESERELGLPIREDQIAALRAARERIDWARAEALERELRHDVMAHVHAYGEQAPSARGILHLGATSCDVTDAADLVLMRAGLQLVRARLLGVARALAAFAAAQRALPILGFTHFQPAQPVTLGKRATLWLQDLLLDLERVEHLIEVLPFRGVKGATGTQASFLQLFGGDHAKVRELERRVAAKMGFTRLVPVSGQTYPRKWDCLVLEALAGIGVSASKFSVDLRLLAHRRELEEPFGKKQIGSSAMPYKRNPMRCERIGSLSRFLIELAPNAHHTAANQWLERTLDDSANRRLAIPEAFLAADAILLLAAEVTAGLVVYPRVIEQNLRRELPFLAVEEVLMAAAQGGGDRQELHERLRVHAHEAAARLKTGDGENDLMQRIAADPTFAAIRSQLSELLDPARFVGRAPQQVDEYLAEVVDPLLAARAAVTIPEGEVRV